MRVAVYGLGYVGLTAAACLAEDGHLVVGIDVDADKVAAVNRGLSPIGEPGLGDLIGPAVRLGRLGATTDGAGLDGCDAALVCVGTPGGPDGAPVLAALAEVARGIAAAVDPGRPRPLAVVVRSTIPPGTIETLVEPIFRARLGEAGMRAVEILHQPEFLRETSAVADYRAPARIVVGTRDGEPSAAAAALNRGVEAPLFHVGWRTAEAVKYADNAFHALKVGFANELGRLCRRGGIDAAALHAIFVADAKLNLSAAYTRPGGAFGGSCLPKELRALDRLGRALGADLHLAEALLRSNEAHKRFVHEGVTAGLAPGAAVLLVGLGFKPGSEDLRESPKLDLARSLVAGGYALAVHDPWLDPAALAGENLAQALTGLPGLNEIVLSAEEVAGRSFDLAIDAGLLGEAARVPARRFVELGALA